MDILKDIQGRTFKSVTSDGDKWVEFERDDGEKFRMFHVQNCCENVSIREIHGDLNDLVGVPIVVAEERGEMVS